jgi:hypothetical protein
LNNRIDATLQEHSRTTPSPLTLFDLPRVKV